MNILADIIYIIHFLIILFVAITPITDFLPLIMVHFTTTVSLLIHWGLNDNTCCLTLLEGYLRGTTPKHTFLAQIINPVYNFHKYDTSNLIWYITLVLSFISVTKLFMNRSALASCLNLVKW